MTYLFSILVVLVNPGAESSEMTADKLAALVRADYASLESTAFVRVSSTTFPEDRFPNRGTERILIHSVMTNSGKVSSEARQLIDGEPSSDRVIFRSDGKRYESISRGEVPPGGCRGLGWRPEPGYSQCVLGGMFTSKIWKGGRSLADYIDDLGSGTITGTATVTLPGDDTKKCYVVEVKRMNGERSVAGVLSYYVGVEDHHLWRYRAERFGSGVISDDHYYAWIPNPTVDDRLFKLGDSLAPSDAILKLKGLRTTLAQSSEAKP